MKRLRKKRMVVGFMLSVLGTLSGCISESSPETNLQQEVEDLQKRTIPDGSHLLDRHVPTIHGWVATADWQFETNYSADGYNEWLGDKLRPDFQVHEGASSPTRFSRFSRGDVEMLSVVAAPSPGMLRVTVKLEIYPD
jgi:hypothetical protein